MIFLIFFFLIIFPYLISTCALRRLETRWTSTFLRCDSFLLVLHSIFSLAFHALVSAISTLEKIKIRASEFRIYISYESTSKHTQKLLNRIFAHCECLRLPHNCICCIRINSIDIQHCGYFQFSLRISSDCFIEARRALFKWISDVGARSPREKVNAWQKCFLLPLKISFEEILYFSLLRLFGWLRQSQIRMKWLLIDGSLSITRHVIDARNIPSFRRNLIKQKWMNIWVFNHFITFVQLFLSK